MKMAFENESENGRLSSVVNLRPSIAKRRTKRMLFDKVDVRDTFQLIEEQYQSDRQIFSKRFDVDLEDLENLPPQLFVCNTRCYGDDEPIRNIRCLFQQSRLERVLSTKNTDIETQKTGC